MYTITMRLSGEFALLLQLQPLEGPAVDGYTPAKVRQLASWCQQLCADAIRELVPSYNSLLLSFSPYHPRWPAVIDELEQACKQWQSQLATHQASSGTRIHVPVWYDGSVAADLEALASRLELTVAQIAQLHTAIEYPVYAVGFTPGFAYLGFVDERLAMPRHPTPRLSVRAGSVAIADRQTAVYPTATPGGWQIIGHCPIPLMPQWSKVGDLVRFVAVDEDVYQHLLLNPNHWRFEEGYATTT